MRQHIQLNQDDFIHAIKSENKIEIMSMVNFNPQSLGVFDNLFIKTCAEENLVELLADFIPFCKAFNINPSCGDNVPLLTAAKNGYTDIVSLLLSRSEVNPAYPGNMPLLLAVRKGHFDIVKMLLNDYRVDPTVNNNEAFITACYKGHLDIVNFLMQDDRVDIEAEEGAGLRFAAMKDEFNVVLKLLEDDRIDVNNNDSAAVVWAGYYGNYDVVKLLVANGADPFARNGIIVKYAAEFGYTDLFTYLLTLDGCDVSVDSNYPLAYAAANGYEQITKLILTHHSFTITYADYCNIREQCIHQEDTYDLLKEFEYLIGFDQEDPDFDTDEEDHEYGESVIPDTFTHQLKTTNPELTFVQDIVDVLNKNRIKATSLTIEMEPNQNVLTIKYY